MISKNGKIWGENVLVFINDTVQINQIYINKAGRCSKHKHCAKYNMFYIQSGQLEIEIWQNNNIVDRTILSAGQSLTVMPNTFHRFTALSDCMALEIYYLNKIEENDIERQDVGSMVI